MRISDFGCGGYDNFHRAVRITSIKDAKELDRFLEIEGSVVESFNENGAGIYVVNLFRGWDRGGNYGGCFINFISESVKTWKETLSDLNSFNRKSKKFDKPFILAQDISDGIKKLEELTDKENKILQSMDLDGKYEHSANVENYLNGYE